MLACAIMIKHKYENSCLYDVELKRVVNFFGVSYMKARKVLDAMKKSEMFVYNSKKKAFYAKPLKSGSRYTYGQGRRKYDAMADYCYKMFVVKEPKLRDVVKELRKVLIFNAIMAVERKCDGLLNKVAPQKKSAEKPSKDSALPQWKIGKAIGLSRASASRYISKMIEDKEVSKTQIVAECVIPHLNSETEKRFRERNPKTKFYVWHSIEHCSYSGWRIYGFCYHAVNQKIPLMMKNVIYNYDRSRMDVLQPTCSSEIDGKWC